MVPKLSVLGSPFCHQKISGTPKLWLGNVEGRDLYRACSCPVPKVSLAHHFIKCHCGPFPGTFRLLWTYSKVVANKEPEQSCQRATKTVASIMAHRSLFSSF